MDTYKATNTTNGKFYIGSTTSFEKRRKEHLRFSKPHTLSHSFTSFHMSTATDSSLHASMRASDLTPEEKMAVFEFLNRGQAVRAYEVQQHLNVSG